MTFSFCQYLFFSLLVSQRQLLELLFIFVVTIAVVTVVVVAAIRIRPRIWFTCFAWIINDNLRRSTRLSEIELKFDRNVKSFTTAK